MNLLKDDPIKIFFKFLIPAVLSAIAIATYSLVDTIVIGQKVGPDGTAACAVLLPIFSLAHFVDLICGIGGSVLMSKSRGEGNKEKANAYYASSFLLVITITLIMWILLLIFQKDVYLMQGVEDTIFNYAYEYGRWIVYALPAFILVPYLGAFIRTDGSPNIVMFVTLIGGVVNIIGDIVFVFPLNMGMDGAGIATALGSITQLIILVLYILLKKTNLHFTKPSNLIKACSKIIKLGFGAGLSQIAMTVLLFSMNNQIMKYSGDNALAVYGFLSVITSLFSSIFLGIGQASQPIVSANFGAGNKERYEKVGKVGLLTAFIFGILFSFICIIIPTPIAKAFMKVTPEINAIVPYIVRVYSISFLPMAINLFVISFFQSIKNESKATIIQVLRGLILPLLLLYTLPLLIEGSGIWWSIAIAELITALFSYSTIRKLFIRNKTDIYNNL